MRKVFQIFSLEAQSIGLGLLFADVFGGVYLIIAGFVIIFGTLALPESKQEDNNETPKN
jgi:hypothetical protein